MTDEELRRVFDHFQKQIDALAMVVGQALGSLAFNDPKAREDLDITLTHWEGQMEGDRSRARIIGRLRSAADKMMSGSRASHPDPEEPRGPW